jgi:CBS domain containing-hemolysin-like protein
MPIYLTLCGAAAAAFLSLFFSTQLYALREFSRSRLADFLGRHNGDRWFESITENTADLVYITAIFRQLSNIMVWVMVFATFERTTLGSLPRYALTVLVAGIMVIFVSINVPHAAARYAATEVVGYSAPILNLIRLVFLPLTAMLHATDSVFKSAVGAQDRVHETQIEEEILSAVEEGEKEGVVDESEREIIESLIEFRDTATSHIMTPRHDIAALPIDANLDAVKRVVEASGHSRIPVYERTLDHVTGILYARDLIAFLGVAAPPFNIGQVIRPALFVPETKSLRDLFSDFRHENVHIAIVLDEYGVTTGVVTIEDVLEELVGEITDEHERGELAMLKRIDDRVAEADTRIRIDDLNRLMGINLPEEAGYETLGGFLTSGFGRIPEKGAVFESGNVRYTVLDALPQRVNRVKIELLSAVTADPA